MAFSFMAYFLTIMPLHKIYKMKKLKIVLQLILSTTLLLTACSKDDTETPGSNGSTTTTPTGPQDTVTTFMVYFTNTVDSTVEIGSYDDPDGPGPISPNVGGVVLKKNASYIVTFYIEDATGSTVYLHNKIKTNGKDYKICISNPLGINVNATDSDGSMPIGLINMLQTSGSTGSANLNFTVKYQKGTKNGTCSPGTVYHTCNIPIYVN